MVGRRGRLHHGSRSLPEVLYRPLVQTWFIRKVVLSQMLLRRQETVGVSQGRFLYFVSENSSVWGLHHLGWALRKEKKEAGNCSFLRSLRKNSLSQTLEPGPSCSSVQVELFVHSAVGGCPLLGPCPEPGLSARETHRTQKVGHLEDCGRDFTLASKMTRASPHLRHLFFSPERNGLLAVV